mmetsp:Transcript_17775/g.29887  ORF Transcript_17775/g.29887 Transcript_17775/m.29887 type:complete len:219 (-) Transcript_17775:674-1330(-)
MAQRRGYVKAYAVDVRMHLAPKAKVGHEHIIIIIISGISYNRNNVAMEVILAAWCSHAHLPLEAFECVLQQHGDGHGPDAARHGSDACGHLLHLVEGNIAHQPVPSLLRRIIDGVDADVNDSRPRLDPVAFDKLGDAHRRDDDVRLPDDLLGVGGARVHHCHCRVAPLQEKSRGHAHNVTPANHDGNLPADLHVVPLQELDAALRGAGHCHRVATALC